MTKADTKDIVAVGRTKHCFVSSEGRPIILKKRFPQLDEKLKELADAE